MNSTQSHNSEESLKMPYFRSIRLENVRTFSEQQQINFTDEQGSISKWNLILGDNGTGKTTILKALAAFVNTFPAYRNNFNEELFIKRDEFKRGENLPIFRIEIDNEFDQVAPLSITTLFDESTPRVRLNGVLDPDFASTWDAPKLDMLPQIAAYGGSRKIGSEGFSISRDHPLSNLFDETKTLANAEDWLLQTDYQDQRKGQRRMVQVKEVLKLLFRGEISDIQIKEDKESHGSFRVFFETTYGWVKMHDLSLGYKTLIAWVVDFARQMLQYYSDSRKPLQQPAVCLVDEIDLHLHPKFQRNLVNFLSKTFPATQFIVTAHSPLIVQSFADANIILLKKQGDHVIVDQNPENIRSYRVDQILTSDLFGLSSSRSPKAERLMQERRKLLLKSNMSDEEKMNVRGIEEELDHIPQGETKMERKVESALDLLARIMEEQNDSDQ